ncbi:MAG TPA: SusD/RagB family nutrient-binding outer membrane lipoprotein [Agriterribacter sp.]|nr:SusD/RagB family nutrient-binding outer membrane lipoprotein [Chitinophagaceae bacterium]HRP31816.1 SusD/RagB family nutrient-binding outer membrane lipoprotein [Agriterribacter sp.]
MSIYKKFTSAVVIVAALFLVNGCTKNFEELNTNPALLSEDIVTPEFLLSGVQYGIGSGLGASDIGDYAGMTVRGDNAPFVDHYDDGAWNAAYTSFGNNLAAIIRKTKDDPDMVNKKAIARILRVWVFSQATDIYGDIPYFDSNKAPDEAVISPKYDTQESIYQDFFKELKEAAAELDPAKPGYGNADLYFRGNVTQWKKFANSLRLRLALRLRYVNSQMAQTNMSDLQESDLIIGMADDVFISTSANLESQRNGMYNAIANGADEAARQDYVAHQGVGKAMLDILVGSSPRNNPLDPRTKVIADTAVLNGATLTPAQPPFGFRAQPLLGSVPVENKYPYGGGSVSQFSLFWYVPVVKQYILKSSEVYFALAEAALFNLKSGDANAYFKKGIEASVAETKDLYVNGASQMPALLELVYGPGVDASGFLDYKEMKDAQISAFLSSPATSLTGSDEQKLEQIINQKIVALYPNTLEGWSEWRRTGYPRVLVASNEQSGFKGVSPRRQHYPNNEKLVNIANNKQAVDRMGGVDDMMKRVWWDANTAAPHPHAGTVLSQPAPWN